MSSIQRILRVLSGVLMILGALFLMALPDIGYVLIMLILSITLIVMGIRSLAYYFSMARFAVGGKMVLFLGVIELDLGVFIGTLYSLPRFYILLFLVASFAVSGVISIVRGLEAKKYGSPAWKWKIVSGAVNLTFVVLCTIFMNSNAVLITIYGIGLIISGIGRIVDSFRRTAIVYIA